MLRRTSLITRSFVHLSLVQCLTEYCSTQEEISRVDQLAEEIGSTQYLKNAFDPILNVILSALDAPPVFMRTKALRALSQILTVDSSVLANVCLPSSHLCTVN